MQSCTLEDLNSVTLQVGLVGQDGIIMASDRLMSQHEGSGFSRLRTSKFIQGRNSICCYSGDIIAEHAANNVRDLELTGDKEEIRQELRESGDKAWRDFGEPCGLSEFGFPRKVIVAIPTANSPLWLIEIYAQSTANPVYDRVVAGDDKNTARHFVNNYLPYPPPPISKLIRLAAHVVLMGAKENASGVGGLEVVAIPNGGSAIFLSSDKEQELAQGFDSVYHSINEMLLQPFDYR